MNTTKKVYRSRQDRIIFGVCGGLAQYFNVDTLIVRLIFLLLFFGGGSGLLIYLIAAIIIPLEGAPSTVNVSGEEKKSDDSFSQRFQGLASEVKTKDRNFLIGLVLFLLGFILLVNNLFNLRVFWLTFWPSFMIIAGLFILFKKRK